jgi:hypothetical protein
MPAMSQCQLRSRVNGSDDENAKLLKAELGYNISLIMVLLNKRKGMNRLDGQ